MKTAVEWLVEKIHQANPSFKFDALIRQAKQMEKEQIIAAAADHSYPTEEIALKYAEQYYNKTFKSE